METIVCTSNRCMRAGRGTKAASIPHGMLIFLHLTTKQAPSKLIPEPRLIEPQQTLSLPPETLLESESSFSHTRKEAMKKLTLILCVNLAAFPAILIVFYPFLDLNKVEEQTGVKVLRVTHKEFDLNGYGFTKQELETPVLVDSGLFKVISTAPFSFATDMYYYRDLL